MQALYPVSAGYTFIPLSRDAIDLKHRFQFVLTININSEFVQYIALSIGAFYWHVHVVVT